MDKIFKLFDVKLKEVDELKLDKGELSVVFATMGVWDKDGDWAEPGFYGKQEIVMLPAHDWSHVPIGKGVTREEGNLAVADIKMNLDIEEARKWLSAIKFDLKNGTPLQQYSYGFRILAGGSKTEERMGRTGRILIPLENGTPGSKIWEVSPVLVGAGEGTRTLSAKGEGKTLCDEAQAVLDAAEALMKRGESLADLRAKDGREISATNKDRLAAVAVGLEKLAKNLVSLTAPVAAEPTPAEIAAKKELVRMAKSRAGIA